jgi:SAM-dependent methyltransferase
MAAQVGQQGRVVATDINPRFLGQIELSNLEVRQHNIRSDPLEPAEYDLVHCRAVLMHLPEPQLAVRRMAAALRIGGWLLIEEADYSSIRAIDAKHPRAESFNQKTQEIFGRVTQSSAMNLFFGSGVRALVEAAGLTEVDNEGVSQITRGGELDARRICIGLPALAERGLASQAECAELQELYNDPSLSYIAPTAFAAWGMRAT